MNQHRTSPQGDFGAVEYPSGRMFGPRMQRDFQLVFIHTGEARIQVEDAWLHLPDQHAVHSSGRASARHCGNGQCAGNHPSLLQQEAVHHGEYCAANVARSVSRLDQCGERGHRRRIPHARPRPHRGQHLLPRTHGLAALRTDFRCCRRQSNPVMLIRCRSGNDRRSTRCRCLAYSHLKHYTIAGMTIRFVNRR